MNEFTSKFAEVIDCTLSGFDRILLRGTLRRLSYEAGMLSYLFSQGILLKEFAAHSEQLTARLKKSSMDSAAALDRPVIHLRSPKESKEEIARGIAAKDGITEGLVCVLTSVDPCYSYQVQANRESKQISLVRRQRKCTHLYHYMIHPTFGFMNARIQTWFPFTIYVCINGREWLARQMASEKLGFSREDNCFVHLACPERAQELMDSQLEAHWPELLNGIAAPLNTLRADFPGEFGADYYWSTLQSEWATDILFKSPEVLRGLYPKLVRYGMTALGSPDVMKFLGRRPSLSTYEGEVVSHLKERQEGVRIKHYAGHNSVKIYDKSYTETAAVLRVETTLNDGAGFKVYRQKEGDEQGPYQWLQLRRGVADMYRRAQVSQACNDRYMNALAGMDESATLEELIGRVAKQVRWKDRSIRALHPFDHDDAKLLEFVSRGEFTVSGLRNRDLRVLLYGPETAITPEEVRRRSARATRLLRMLRAHKILTKAHGTHRYQLTRFGRQLSTAISAAKQTPISRFLDEAA